MQSKWRWLPTWRPQISKRHGGADVAMGTVHQLIHDSFNSCLQLSHGWLLLSMTLLNIGSWGEDMAEGFDWWAPPGRYDGKILTTVSSRNTIQ